jgi:hypothetical protein
MNGNLRVLSVIIFGSFQLSKMPPFQESSFIKIKIVPNYPLLRYPVTEIWTERKNKIYNESYSKLMLKFSVTVQKSTLFCNLQTKFHICIKFIESSKKLFCRNVF